MSIYATLWRLRFPRYGDFHSGCEWIEVVAQGVPAFVGASPEEDDPYGEFLPPPIESATDENEYRAIVFVTPETQKGNVGSPEEYDSPLLVLTGAEYGEISFAALHGRLCAALRGSRPKFLAQIGLTDGAVKVLFDDGTSKIVRKSGDGS